MFGFEIPGNGVGREVSDFMVPVDGTRLRNAPFLLLSICDGLCL
jgi:hypothetical protein